MGNGHIINIDGLHKDILIKIFDDKGGTQLLDRVTDDTEKIKVIHKWFNEHTLAIKLQLRSDRKLHGKC